VSSLADIHHRQGRAFLRAGDAQRAVELLEKARALARGDAQLMQEILGDLAEAYEKAGAKEKAKRCGEQLGHLAGRGATNGREFEARNASLLKDRRQKVWREAMAGVAAILLIACAIFGAWEKWRPPKIVSAVSATTQAAATEAVVMNAVVSAAVPRIAATTQTIAVAPDILDDRVRASVVMLVLMGHYEGTINGEHVKVDVPLDSGSAFVLKKSGILLTSKHLTHEVQENDFPSTLQAVKLPTVTLRDIGYVLCFGQGSNDRSDAKLLYESDKFDVAIIQTDRHFAWALDGAGREAANGEPIYAWGYPVEMTDIFNNPHADRHGVEEMLVELQDKHSINLLAAFSSECFKAVGVAGTVSVAERNMDGTACVEFDAKIDSGENGGPVVDASRKVIAMVQSGGKGAKAGYNYGILIDQLQDEIAPYMRGD
jgi:S1-C subfamily serine protease